MADEATPTGKPKKATATQFFLRGLAISLPSILTIVILMWVAKAVNEYVIWPTSTVVRWSIAQFIDRSLPTDSEKLVKLPGRPPLEHCGIDYRITKSKYDSLQERLRMSVFLKMRPADQEEEDAAHERNSTEADGAETRSPAGEDERGRPRSNRPLVNEYEVLPDDLDPWDDDTVYVSVGDGTRAVPYKDYALVAENVRASDMPTTVTSLYMEVVIHRHFQGLFGLSAFAISITIIIVYFLGRIVTARVGAWGFHTVETLFLGKLPVVSNVYGSVKQVTDFLFSERTIEYNRVVAVEYPRRGIWSLGFATSESMLEITAAAGEPLVSVLIPTSPMPVTGYTINVPKGEVMDLNVTIDQAFQYCLSCGVLVPPQQRVTPELLQQELAKRLTGMMPPTARSQPPRRDAIPESPGPTPPGDEPGDSGSSDNAS